MRITSSHDHHELGMLSKWLSGSHSPAPTSEYRLVRALAQQEVTRLALRDALRVYMERPDGDQAALEALLADCKDPSPPQALPGWVTHRLNALEGIPAVVMRAVHRAARQL